MDGDLVCPFAWRYPSAVHDDRCADDMTIDDLMKPRVLGTLLFLCVISIDGLMPP